MPILAFAQTPPVTHPAHDVDEHLLFELRRGSGEAEQVFTLDDAFAVQLGVQGLDGAGLDLTTSNPAGWDGDIVDDITAAAAELFIPMLVDGGDLEGLRAAKTALRDFTNPRKGAVRLRITRPSGGFREIVGLRTKLVDGALDGDSWGVSLQKLGLVLHCSDPFWTEDDTAWDVSWSVRSDDDSPLPILPLAPGASQALDDTNNVNVRGDVDTYPVWRVTGPMESVTVRDVARDLQWTLTATISADETWIVDCRKGRQGVFDPAGVRSRGNLSSDAFLWGLQPGVSQVQTTVAGASAGASVHGTAPSRWESY